jgi:hypothetical protein
MLMVKNTVYELVALVILWQNLVMLCQTVKNGSRTVKWVPVKEVN